MVTVNSGQLPTAKGVEEGYDLAIVIGKWQSVAQGRFRNDCRDLLQMIDETDEMRLWEKNVGGFTYSSRDEFLQQKVLIDYDLTESALEEIVGKLKHGEGANLSNFVRDKIIHENPDEKTQEEVGAEFGVSQQRVSQIQAKDVIIEKVVKEKRVIIRYQISSYTKPETAATKIREKFGDEFAGLLKQSL